VLKLLAVTAAAWPGGCTPPPTTQPGTYKTIAPDLRRDINLAAHLDRLGVEMLEHNQLPQAEAKFKEALTADMFYGPAHSNLGTVYYKQGKLYLAAWEYQYAAKLMPEKAAPINNQGMVQERAGRLDEAAKLYERAAKLDAESAQIAANLARTYIRMDRRDQATMLVLQKIVARDSRPEWVS
jgi:Flp pilus assembly protein TadD